VIELLAALVRATPLLLCGLAVALAFRAGIWNIGAEGQFLAGAVAATWVGTKLTFLSPLGALVVIPLVAALAGAAWAAVPALLRARFGVLEVITTIMLNFVAEHFVAWLVHGPLQEAARTYPQSDPIGAFARIPSLVAGSRLTWALPAAIAIAALLWFVVERTRPGFELRVAGANPVAARVSAGVDVKRVTSGAFLLSGAVAGLAGAAEVCGVTFALYEKLSPGYGYTAIAVALLARLDMRLVVASALLFGGLEAGAAALQRSAGIPSVTVYAVEALIVLVIVALDQRLRRAQPA
jgi:ABC-type uncharacterized transport system permease subunit